MLLNAVLRLSRGQEVSLASALSGIDVGQAILVLLLVQLATLVGLVLCIVPGLVVAFVTWFSLYFVVDQHLGAIDALKASIGLVGRNLGPMLMLALSCLGAAIIGVILCGVGLLVALPIVVLAQVYTFRTLTGDHVKA